ncbi:MAG TPA: hypothetical protein VF618_18910 [Thermoanaerobaculia bacterium]
MLLKSEIGIARAAEEGDDDEAIGGFGACSCKEPAETGDREAATLHSVALRQPRDRLGCMTQFVKVFFPLDVDEDGVPPIASEALNARRESPGFVLENTPFFATGVALGDRVEGISVGGSSDVEFIFSSH